MKKTAMVIGTLLISISASAQNTSTRTASEMINILQSEKVQALLSQENRVGHLRGIKYLMSGRAVFGPVKYELSFESYANPISSEKCTVIADVNQQTGEVMAVSQVICN